jgi:hypothetical protein
LKIPKGSVYVPLVVSTSRSFPHSWLITGFVTRLTRRLSLVEQELLPFRSPWVHLHLLVGFVLFFFFFKIWKKDKSNGDKIWTIWKKGKLNSEKIWKIWKKSKLNSLFTFQLTFLPYFPYLFTIQLTFLPYFPYHFTVQPPFLPHFPYLFTIQLTFLPY